MEDLKITLVQTALHWEDKAGNLADLEEKLWTIPPSDLIILPEMFTTGFSNDAEKLAEPNNLTTWKWMKQIAMQKNAVVVGSYIAKENAQYFNRLVWMQPDGQADYYDKRHLFRTAHEHDVYTAGTKKLIKELKGWRICPLICYDLRFPVWSRQNDIEEYDLLLYVANWPEKRRLAWNSLLPARAIENLAYVAGVNRVGRDGKGLSYSGDSAVYNFKGEQVLHVAYEEGIHTIQLSGRDLLNFRKEFAFHLDRDLFTISS